jgi:WD40 repeat protein
MLIETPRRPASTDELEALIREARERQRRRRQRIAAVLLAVAAAGAAAYGITRSVGGGAPSIERIPNGPVVNIAAFKRHGQLAFVSGATLWLLDGTTGKLHRLPVPGSGFTPSQPAFSADGKWLAYLEQHTSQSSGDYYARLWIARSDGSHPHVVQGLRVYRLIGWSPTADALAVAAGPERTTQPCPCYSPTTLRTVAPDGSYRTVARTSWLYGAAWSPDGTKLAVAADRYPHSTIAVYPSNGGRGITWLRMNNHQRLNGMHGVLFQIAGWWLHAGIGFWVFGDGAVHNNDETPLDLIARPGMKPRVLAQTLSDGTTEVVSVSRLGALAVVADISHGRNGGRVYWDKKQVQLCSALAACRPVVDRASKVTVEPAWSPDGRTLALIEAPDYVDPGWSQQVMQRWYGEHQLLLYNISSKTIQAIATAKGATVPIWSPDAHSLLYVSGNALWLLPSLSSRPVEIAAPLFTEQPWPAYYGQIAWSAQFAWTNARTSVTTR